MPWSNESASRFRALMHASGFTQVRLSDATGIPKVTLQRILAGGSVPDEERLKAMLTAIGATSQDLEDRPDEDVVTVPVYDMQVAAGAGRIGDRLSTVFHWPFPRHWAEANFIDVRALMTFRVSGDSQWPELGDGDLVVVDTRSRRPNGDLHVIRIGDELRLKRIEQAGSTIKLQSRNPLYPDEVINLGEEDGDLFEVVGRAVTAIKMF